MVFITLGTQGNQFPRCLQMVEELTDMLHPGHEFIAQIGNTEYKSNKIKVLEYVSETEFKRLIGEADVVITHAGSGSLFNAIKQGKKTIAVARLKKYKEMLNDHQTELVKKLSDDGYILDGTYSIVDAWKKLEFFQPRPCDFECTLSQEISHLIDKWLL